MWFCSLLCDYGARWEEVSIQADDFSPATNASELPPPFTCGDESCFENKRG